MMAAKWDFEVRIVADGINAGLNPEILKEQINPFERRQKRVKTPEEIEELAAAKQRVEDIKRRVEERRMQRAQSDGSGR